MLNRHSFHQPAVAEKSLAGIIRMIRQACVLRERGDGDGAARLRERELATAIRDCRLAHGPDALPESALQALFATEERRVAEAAILSELLVPRLAEALAAAHVRASAPGARPALGASPAPVAAAPAGPPAIPDLLDAMLAAERTGRRPAAHVPSGT